MGRSCINRSVSVAVVILAVMLSACGDDSGNPARFCDLNTELEAFHNVDFLPDDVRREHGESRIVASFQRPLVVFDFEEVDQFASVFGEFVEVAPADIRPSIGVLADLFAPVFAGTDPAGPGMDIDTVIAAFSEEAHAAGFALEDWVAANCPA